MTVLIIRTKKVARDQAPHCRRKEKKTASEGSREVPRVFLFPPLRGLVPGYKERREKACADEFQITAYSYVHNEEKKKIIRIQIQTLSLLYLYFEKNLQ